MIESPTLDRLVSIIAALFLTCFIGILALLGATPPHLLLRALYSWNKTENLWISLVLSETVTTYFMLKDMNDYEESTVKMISLIQKGGNKFILSIKLYLAAHWRAIRASLFFMFLIFIAALIIQSSIEESGLCQRDIPLWIPLFACWLFFIYTQFIREQQKERDKKLNSI